MKISQFYLINERADYILLGWYESDIILYNIQDNSDNINCIYNKTMLAIDIRHIFLL